MVGEAAEPSGRAPAEGNACDLRATGVGMLQKVSLFGHLHLKHSVCSMSASAQSAQKRVVTQGSRVFGAETT